MRNIDKGLIVLLNLTIGISVFGQDILTPDWIRGTWNNSFESNSNNFEYWSFASDSIFFNKGFPVSPSKRSSLNEKYSSFELHHDATDSIYKLEFNADKETVTYEFKLLKVSHTDNSAMTYSITKNGVEVRKHSTSINLLLTK